MFYYYWCIRKPWSSFIMLQDSIIIARYHQINNSYHYLSVFQPPNQPKLLIQVLATVQRDNIERAGKEWSVEEEAAFKQPILDKYDLESHAYYSSARLWDDGVIDPADTRAVLGLSFASCLQNNDGPQDTKFGVFRM